MRIELDKKDIVRAVEKYYKNINNTNTQAFVGLIYDNSSNYLYPYVRVDTYKRNIIDTDYLGKDELKDIFSYIYNCNVNNITFKKEKEVNLSSCINENLYGLILDVSIKSKIKK